jgi:hypothetical protein
VAKKSSKEDENKMNEKDLFRKYTRRLEKEFGEEKPLVSVSYAQFKKESLPKHLSLYEKLCNKCEKILKVRPDKKTEAELKECIGMCHLSISPAGAVGFAVILSFLLITLTSLVSFLVFGSLFFVLYFIVLGLILIIVLVKLPSFLANSWRLKASNQMVECVFYVATYMRHTSNLELAIKFAAEHLSPPLSLDMRKVLWDVETEKYDSVKESLDVYLESWRKWNLEFIEAFHLIEGSLYEPSESRRQTMVDKALDVMLQETYEKMLHYAHELKNPMTTLYMLGIVLPILGLVILPLVASFMTSETTSPLQLSIYIAVIYNVTLPLGIYYLGRMVLSKRPTGYGETDISEINPEAKKQSNVILKAGKKELKINPLIISAAVGIIFLLIGLSPIIIASMMSEQELLQEKEFFPGMSFLEYRETVTGLAGPYGLGAAVLGLFVTLSAAFSLGLYFVLRSRNVMKMRTEAKALEDEFASALFHLGNRLGDGFPAEIAFGKVADVMKGTKSGEFFAIASNNIQKLGMSVKEAIFNKKIGAMVYFPSSLIESSMKVLIESSKKGPRVASQALINVSQYIKDIHRVNERLRDLLADIISDMKQQVNFLAPAISGIVVGITSMIVMILGKLSGELGRVIGGGATGAPVPTGILDMFGNSIPTYYFQIIVGVYIVEIIFILTILVNGVENGSDKLAERYNLGRNLLRGTTLYTIISLAVMVTFNFIAASILVSIVS